MVMVVEEMARYSWLRNERLAGVEKLQIAEAGGSHLEVADLGNVQKNVKTKWHVGGELRHMLFPIICAGKNTTLAGL